MVWIELVCLSDQRQRLIEPPGLQQRVRKLVEVLSFAIVFGEEVLFEELQGFTSGNFCGLVSSLGLVANGVFQEGADRVSHSL